MKGLPKVLFVDDQDEVLEDIKVQVSDVCDPYGATTSEEGLEIFEKEGPFTVVVSDQILPGVDGADFLAQVIRRDPHVSTMLLTGHANYADAMTAVNDGQDHQQSRPSFFPASSTIFVFWKSLIHRPPLDAMQSLPGERQRDLMVAERVLLHETLVGAVNALTETLATVKPRFFGRAIIGQAAVKRLAGEIARKLEFPTPLAGGNGRGVFADGINHFARGGSKFIEFYRRWSLRIGNSNISKKEVAVPDHRFGRQIPSSDRSLARTHSPSRRGP